MKKTKLKLSGFFEPKETWFILPMILVDYNKIRLAFAFGFMCFGVSVEFSKEDE